MGEAQCAYLLSAMCLLASGITNFTSDKDILATEQLAVKTFINQRKILVKEFRDERM